MHIASLKEIVTPAEWALRVELAACYRLAALYGWTDLIFTHISAKLPQPGADGQAEFLINPYGLLFEEITASSLLRIDAHGRQLSASPYHVNRAGFVIHSAIHQARHDAACVIHTHTRAGVAVSAQRQGLLPLSQQSTLLMDSLGYHGYEGVAVHEDEQIRLQRDLGRHQHLILRNHGLLAVGPTIPDAFMNMYTLESACQIQLAAQAGGELTLIPTNVLAGVSEAVGLMDGGVSRGQQAWPALLRRLDRLNPGYDA